MKSACALVSPRFDARLSTKRSRCASISARIFLPMARRSRSALAQRIAGQLLRDLHHLLLVDDDALRLLHQVVDLGMDRGELLLAVLARIVGRDVLHRAGR